jgi:peptidoglycan/LPS O-acetylase OafA/YrhL
MSATELRNRAQQRQSRARFEARLQTVIGLACSVIFAWAFTRAHEALARMGWGLLTLWGVYAAFHAYKWIRPQNLPQDAPIGTCLEFYRSELERRRDYLRHRWWRSGLPFCILGIVMAIVGTGTGARKASPHPLLNAIPFLGLLAVWAVAFPLVKKKLGQENLQQEIEELRAFEMENR